MRSVKTFNEANLALNEFMSPRPGAAGYKLDRMSALMDYLDRPQDHLSVIHVAGTSGKTSTAYYCAALLREAGYSTGLTVSPHVDQVNERAQINLLPLEEAEFCRELSVFLALVDRSRLVPSYFELLVAFAYWLFRKREVDYAIVEVGLGGLLDGTNVVRRDDKVCVITDIGLDHTEILGNTLGEIALQKAGIIQPRNTVFMNRQGGAVMAAVRRICSAKEAGLRVVEPSHEVGAELTTLPLFQRRNFQLALEATAYVVGRDHARVLSGDQVLRASTVCVPARMEVVPFRGKTIVLDGSHNVQKISALVESMAQRFPGCTVTVLVAFGDNKQASVSSSLRMLSRISERIILTKFDGGQDEARVSVDPEVLASSAAEAGFAEVTVEPDPRLALDALVSDTASIGLVTGSFYLLSQVRPIVRSI